MTQFAPEPTCEPALEALQRCEQSLVLAGIEPSGLLRELHRRIRREPPPPDPEERRYGT